jgi:NADH-quinone oxidoreductase subunit H
VRNRTYWLPYGVFFNENGIYLFAEYANMFIHQQFLAVLFFGGYNYPGMAWAVENWGVNIANIIGIAVLFGK